MLKLSTEPADAALPMPVHGVLTSQVTDTWHGSRDGGVRRHEGQDIFAPEGTPVFSATKGIVTRVSKVERGRGGIYAFIMGPGGRHYYYAHLSALADGMSVGDAVTANTVIGYVGNTGNARTTPPHLHFGMYTRHGAENPFSLMVNRKLAYRN
jgi:murein DD-endopeptidase MepM/ murein hydrolase activator NlpD